MLQGTLLHCYVSKMIALFFGEPASFSSSTTSCNPLFDHTGEKFALKIEQGVTTVGFVFEMEDEMVWEILCILGAAETSSEGKWGDGVYVAGIGNAVE